MVLLFLRTFFPEDDRQNDTDDGAAQVALPGDVLQFGQGGDHAPEEAPVKEHHDERDYDELSVAADEATHDEEEVESVDQGTGSDMGGIGVADAPGEQSTGNPCLRSRCLLNAGNTYEK